MLNLINHPFISIPLKFLARIAIGALWGIALSPAELEVKAVFFGLMAVVALPLCYSFIAFHRRPGIAVRIELYALVVAGEAMAVGAVVLACLGAFTGQLETLALCLCAFGGTLFPMYGILALTKDLMSTKKK